MKLFVYNLTGQRIWLTLRHDFYKKVIHISLYSKEPPQKAGIEFYENLLNDQLLVLWRLEWSDSTKVDFDISGVEPQPKRYDEEKSDSDGTVRIFTFKLANGAS